MFSNQPLPRLRCKHQTNHWCYGFHIPHQVLIVFIALLISPLVLAEGDYYTWVDEFGRVHNTPIPSKTPKDSKDSQTTSDQQHGSKEPQEKSGFYTWVDEFGRVHNTPAKVSPVENAEEYLTEEEFEKKAAQERKDNPQFYTWVDEQGRIRNSAVPSTEVVVTSSEDTFEQQVTDHTLVSPLRVNQTVTNSGCCQNYKANFKDNLTKTKPRVFTKPQFSNSFYTQDGGKPAWFFNLPNFNLENTDKEPLLRLRLRDTDQPLALIALNKDYQPLYYIHELEPQYFPETWRTVAMHETLISVADEDVHAVIVYFPLGVENKANLEVQWLP